MREIHQCEWGRLFAEIIQRVLNEQLNGNQNAFSEFIEKETKRVLNAVEGLTVDGLLMLEE